jgi:nucleoside-diphosphate-sugar epimerase
MTTVCVTGGSGFIGSHSILQLLAAGHEVRATIRDRKREADVRAMLTRGGMARDAPLSCHAADLMDDSGWADAMKGCDYVLHVASPFPARAPKNDEELIVPAREGALRALRAARDAGVRRVVLTSSFAAIGYGHPSGKTQFDESDWTIPDAPGVPAYPKSKTLAERAAWDFVEREGGGLELSVVNPTAVFGPILGPDFSTSIVLIQRLMNGAVPGLPKLRFGVVDVRDVADLHIRAMTNPAAKGERFIAVGDGFKTILEMARILRERMGAAAARVPTRQLPDWLVRLAALWDPGVRTIATELGKRKNADHDKAARLLGWSPRPDPDAIVATAESLGRFGLLKDGAGNSAD